MKKTRLQELINAILSVRSILSDDVAFTTPAFFPEWKSDSTYAVGDRVLYGSDLYKCLQAHTSQTTWTPSDSPSLWVQIDDPSIEWPEWVQPTGSTDAYAQGAKVSHNGKHWISNIPANTYEPGVYGWDEATE